MSFDDLCRDFDRRRPTEPPIGRAPWFNATWENENDSVNDLLVRLLREHSLEYLRTMNGDIWFFHQGNWRRCDYEIKGGVVQFFMLEYIDN